ncbi:hypothetical protein AWENTII_005708 [Aspergillus wentii]
MDSSHGISLQVTIFIKPEDLPKFWESFMPVYNKVIAEPECTFFEVYQSPEEPGTLSWDRVNGMVAKEPTHQAVLRGLFRYNDSDVYQTTRGQGSQPCWASIHNG